MLGTIGSAILTNYNAIVAGIAGTFTAGYMAIRFFREYRKYRRDSFTVTVKTQHPTTPEDPKK